MDMTLIRSLVTFLLFVFFMLLIYQVYSKKNKKHYEKASNLLFEDGDERSIIVSSDKERLVTDKHEEIKTKKTKAEKE